MTMLVRLAGFLTIGLVFFATAVEANAKNITSKYTKIDLDKDCVFFDTHEQGGTANCTGYKDLPILFSEGDLRQQMRYGIVDESYTTWKSFGEFNQINDTIEWRIMNGRPFATVLRWFIENHDPQAGQITPQSRGNVLVISTVGTRETPKSCFVGFVDARANKNANELARFVADTFAEKFVCGLDLPIFHGKRGKWSGTPTVSAE